MTMTPAIDLFVERLRRSVQSSCKHELARDVRSESGWPADTYIVTRWCPNCEKTWTEEFTIAQLERMEREPQS